MQGAAGDRSALRARANLFEDMRSVGKSGVPAVTTIRSKQAPAPGEISTSYKNVVLGLLVLAYTFNFVDRTIVMIIGQAIKVDLRLSDLQLGLLGGLAFAVLYTVLGLPIARLAERRSRVNIITIAIVVWSGFTVLCGTATTFLQLILLRVGVGVGEAGLSPPAHSLISDYFEPRRRASALSIYSFGIPLGSLVGSVVGGWVAQTYGWRAAFVVVGAPGLIVALLLKWVVKEPRRGSSDIQPAAGDVSSAAPASAASDADEVAKIAPPPLRAVAGRIFGRPAFRHMVAGITVASFAGFGTGQYMPAYFIRTFHLDLATVGFIFGMIGGVSALLGTFLGGFLTDWASKKSVRWYALVPAIGLTMACPLYILVFIQDDWQVAAALGLLPGIFHYTCLGPTFGVIQNAVSLRMRATAAALLLFCMNFIALGLGPPFCGWCIDMFSRVAFSGLGLGEFSAMCPGGVGLADAGAAIDTACRAANALGTRQGIVLNLLLYAWAGAHYLLAARTLPEDMRQSLAATAQEAALLQSVRRGAATDARLG